MFKILKLSELSFARLSVKQKQQFAKIIGEHDYYLNPWKVLQYLVQETYQKCRLCNGSGRSTRNIYCYNCNGRGAKSDTESLSPIDALADSSDEEISYIVTKYKK